MDDEAWVERLRRAVADGLEHRDDAARETPRPPATNGRVEDEVQAALMSTQVASALRDLEQRLAAVDTRLRQLNEGRDRLVDDIADAVIARLDARDGRISGG